MPRHVDVWEARGKPVSIVRDGLDWSTEIYVICSNLVMF